MTVTHWEGPGLDAWRPFTPTEVARLLAGCDAPWCVVGGFSIDLYLGRTTRHHEDLEIAVPAGDFDEVRPFLSGYELYSVGDGEVRRMHDGEGHPPGIHQTWVLDAPAQAWRFDVMLEPGDAATWVYRRDERISAPRSRMVASRDGIPYVAPEGALLYKAKAPRDKDEADFAACLPEMDAGRRGWLADALRTLHPRHEWLDRLG